MTAAEHRPTRSIASLALAGFAALAGSGLPIGPAAAAEDAAAHCAIYTPDGSALSAAQALFSEQCGASAPACEPIAGGGWRCDAAELPDVIAPAAPNCESTPARTLGAAHTGFSLQCPTYARRDCDPLAAGWVCSSTIIGARAPRIHASSASSMFVQAIDDSVALDAEPTVPPAVATTRDDANHYRDGDLIALHYDNCPDRDDGQAMAAGKTMLDTLDIHDRIVVNGTCGDSIQHWFQADSAALATQLFDGQALDAHADRDHAVSTSADQWAATLAGGAHVWVAEGGPSDVTADILTLIAARYPWIDLGAVHVIQHSGWNQRYTDAEDLAAVQATVDYRLIRDGNDDDNGTAGLATGNASDAAPFIREAIASDASADWRAAFDYLPPACEQRHGGCKLDFSDTVLLLEIVGDSQTRNVDDFAARYL